MKKSMQMMMITPWNNVQKERKYENIRDMEWRCLAEAKWLISIKDFPEVPVSHVALVVWHPGLQFYPEAFYSACPDDFNVLGAQTGLYLAAVYTLFYIWNIQISV